MQGIADTRRYWLPELLILILLALVGTLPFWWSDLDIRVASRFYHPDAEDPWYQARAPLWNFLYQASTLLIGLVAVGSLSVLAAGRLKADLARRRVHAIFILTLTVAGPGLIINGVVKDYWGRPRPHETRPLGGTREYLPPFAVGESGEGKSFPSGHSAVGFLFSAFFLIWLRTRPRMAWAALIGALLLGSLIGLGRMVAGDHFLSDVIWSAILTYGVAWVLYYFILRVPQREDAAALRPPPVGKPLKHPWLAGTAFLLASLLLIAGVFLATPAHETRNLTLHTGRYSPPPRALIIDADVADLTLFWAQFAGNDALIRLKARGFGLPGSRVPGEQSRSETELTYRVRHQGLFTEKNTSVVVGVNPNAWDRVELHTGRGNLLVYPLKGASPTLVLDTADGSVDDRSRAGVKKHDAPR